MEHESLTPSGTIFICNSRLYRNKQDSRTLRPTVQVLYDHHNSDKEYLHDQYDCIRSRHVHTSPGVHIN